MITRTLGEANLDRHQSEITALVKALPCVQFAFLHGSAVEQDIYNDVDVALWVDREMIPPDEDLFLGIRLSREWSRQMGFPVDVHVLNDAKLAFKYHVTKGIVVYATDYEFVAQFKERTWDLYLDFKPVATKYLRELA